MQEDNNLSLNNQNLSEQEVKDGQNKCPKCGSTDISLNPNTGKLRCNFCKHEFEPVKVNQNDISNLSGETLSKGAKDIENGVKDVITLKCSSCGAEVVINTTSSSQARCHWCRNTLSINNQVPNGSIPDVVLPFKVKKEEAKKEIEKFVGKRKFFANPNFKKEFTTENIMGVYFPYMLVDINSHVSLSGSGERQTNVYTRGSNQSKVIYYDANLYSVKRSFDLTIDDLTVESSKDKLNKDAHDKTNNVINAIMPFDTENCVKYDANYLRGYTSEKRDTNIEEIRSLVNTEAKDIARISANDSVSEYDRGVRWDTEEMKIDGQSWQAAYLPVWLYSYQEVKKDKKVLHYVAVNARTKETMGSVPIHMPKLILMSILVEILGIIAMLFVDIDYSWVFLLTGIVYYFIMYTRYRNKNARHFHEKETKYNISNLVKEDNFISSEKGLTTPKISGANNDHIDGENFTSELINEITNLNPVADIIKDITKINKL